MTACPFCPADGDRSSLTPVDEARDMLAHWVTCDYDGEWHPAELLPELLDEVDRLRALLPLPYPEPSTGARQ